MPSKPAPYPKPKSRYRFCLISLGFSTVILLPWYKIISTISCSDYFFSFTISLHNLVIISFYYSKYLSAQTFQIFTDNYPGNQRFPLLLILFVSWNYITYDKSLQDTLDFFYTAFRTDLVSLFVSHSVCPQFLPLHH